MDEFVDEYTNLTLCREVTNVCEAVRECMHVCVLSGITQLPSLPPFARCTLGSHVNLKVSE